MILHDDIKPGQHWLRWWLVPWCHQAITWTNVNFLKAMFHNIHLREISQQMPRLLFCIMSLEITYNWKYCHISQIQWINHVSKECLVGIGLNTVCFRLLEINYLWANSVVFLLLDKIIMYDRQVQLISWPSTTFNPFPAFYSFCIGIFS